MTLAPPPVPIGPQDSFQTAWLNPLLVDAQEAGLKAPVEVNGTLLDGFQVQPSCSWVPPTATTNGELACHHTVGPGNLPVSLCCLLMPRLPKSPEAAKRFSLVALLGWNTRANL